MGCLRKFEISIGLWYERFWLKAGAAKMDVSFNVCQVVLVGNSNNIAFNQEYLGTLVFRNVGNKHVPFLRNTDAGGDLNINFDLVRRGDYSLEVPFWFNEEGLRIRLESEGKKYTFVTSLNPKAGGSSGNLIFGGPD